ncbi:MAG: polysaccharide biosynthesis protein [Deltaproteobacteria bacterium]|nr:polysaccharide biosynthesis protein [Deltaproteobacteria bacterium]
MRNLSIDKLASLVTKRPVSLFQDDFDKKRASLEQQIRGSRILVIGGAGSIGSSTVRILVPFGPSALHVVDHNENDLAELVRHLRNDLHDISSTDLRMLPLDFGSALMHRFLSDAPDYDFILNFAALKHVRSEKDVYSLLQMLDVNLVKAARFLGWLSEKQPAYRYFCVSTDKAANPVNLMGASKHLMEQLIFSREVLANPFRIATSARFANVAFSKGSLLESFLIRLNHRQPLAAPEKTLRYFVTPLESGQICVLAAFCAPNGHLLVPNLNPDKDMTYLETMASMVLQAHGLEPRIYRDEALARKNVAEDLEEGCYPLLLTPLDTSGEKSYEEFVGAGETTVDVGMDALSGIRPISKPADPLIAFVKYLKEVIADPDRVITKEDILERMKGLIPGFEHIETGKSLDERM